MERSHIAGWASDSPTPAQLKEFFAQIENRRITKRKLQVFLRSGTSYTNEEIAREILGEDIIFPEEIAKARGLSYSEEQVKHLDSIFPPVEVFHWCKTNNYAIVASPPDPMSLLDIRLLKSDLFYSRSSGWYADRNFAKNDRTTVGWLAIRKDIVPKSTNKNWEEQIRLLANEERIPNAGEFAWFITTFYEVRGIRLFERIYARTSSVDSGGGRVPLGFFDSCGLDVNDWWDVPRNDDLGLASARKF